MKRTIPINTDRGGQSKTIKADYYKMGWTNFTRELLGYRDGFAATAIMEIYEERNLGCEKPAKELREG